MDSGTIGQQIKDFQAKFDGLQDRVRDLTAENEALRAQVKNASFQPSQSFQQPVTQNNDVMASQLIETESFLAQERQQVVRITHQASGYQVILWIELWVEQVLETKRRTQKIRAAITAASQAATSVSNWPDWKVNNRYLPFALLLLICIQIAIREARAAENQRTIELDEARAKVDQLEKILETKNSILQKTKDERDEINMQNEKRTMEAETKAIDLLTKVSKVKTIKMYFCAIRASKILRWKNKCCCWRTSS